MYYKYGYSWWIKKIGIQLRMCYHFDNIIKIENFNLHKDLIDEKSYRNILVFNILYKRLIAKTLRIRFEKIY